MMLTSLYRDHDTGEKGREIDPAHGGLLSGDLLSGKCLGGRACVWTQEADDT